MFIDLIDQKKKIGLRMLMDFLNLKDLPTLRWSSVLTEHFYFLSYFIKSDFFMKLTLVVHG